MSRQAFAQIDPYLSPSYRLDPPEVPECPKCESTNVTIGRDESECHDCGFWDGVDPDDLYDRMREGD